MTSDEIQSLTDRELWTLKEFVENTLRKSGAVLLELYGRGNRKLKFDDELVTEAENRAWDIIQTKFDGSFEGHGFLRDLSDEQLLGPGAPRFIWIVDTLDGAASFQSGMPVWGISAAFFEKFWPVLGFLYLPVTGELYSAYAGKEAFLNDTPIKVRQDSTIDNESLVLVYSRFHRDFTTNFPGKIRNLGSSAGHLAYIARGAADACIMKNVTVRDLAAGSILLQAAGGEIRYLDGRPFHIGEILDGHRIDDPLIAAPKGSHDYFVQYFQKT